MRLRINLVNLILLNLYLFLFVPFLVLCLYIKISDFNEITRSPTLFGCTDNHDMKTLRNILILYKFDFVFKTVFLVSTNI